MLVGFFFTQQINRTCEQQEAIPSVDRSLSGLRISKSEKIVEYPFLWLSCKVASVLLYLLSLYPMSEMMDGGVSE